MTRRFSLSGVTFAALVAMLVAVPVAVSAESGSGRDETRVRTVQDDSPDTPDDSDNRVRTARSGDDNPSVSDIDDANDDSVQEGRKAEARQRAMERLEQKKAEVKTKLDAKRLEQCEKREAKINAITLQRANQGAKHLEVFKGIKDRVIAFKEQKNLQPANYEALLADVATKEAAAVAAIEATKVAKFDCSAEGSDKTVGTYVRDTVHGTKDALKVYRTSIKDLIRAVKQSAPDDSSSNSSTSNDAVRTEGNQ